MGLELTFQDLYNEVSRYVGTYGSSGPSSDDLTEAKRTVNAGYRRFLSYSNWSFLWKTTSLSIESGTWVYDLPEYFREIKVPFRYELNTGYPPITSINEEWIMQARAESSVTGYPQFYAIRQGTYHPQSGSRYEAIFWPTPNSDYTLYYTYYFMPDELENDDDVPVGGSEYAEALRRCVLAEAESFQDESEGVQEKRAMQRLSEALEADKGKRGRHVGTAFDSKYRAWQTARGEFRATRVTFNT